MAKRQQPETLGTLIEAARTMRNMSIAELARQSGLDRAMVSRIASGRLVGSPATLEALADALDLDHGRVLRAAARSVEAR